jgi:predicted carbohydrate-binding protein with CBM5 and CBM33 domain
VGKSWKSLGLVLGGVVVLGVTMLVAWPASAHGAMQIPGSRTFLCYEDGLRPTGEIVPQNPACAAAVAQSGVTPLYNWFAVGNRSGATSGGLAGFIPDGKLCSGNSNYFDFSGFDIVSNDWPKTHLTSGSTIQIKYNKWAAHPGTFSLYITKPDWDPSQPLTWSEMNTVAFSSATDPPSVGDPGSVDSYYFWNATLPAGYSGYQIIYSVWARSDSTETFYGCSDVVFDGGNGEVTGLGGGTTSSSSPTASASASPTRSSSPSASPSRSSSPSSSPSRSTSPSVSPSVSRSTSPSASPSTSTSSGSGGCTAAYSVSTQWSGGFQGQVTVTNTGTAAISGWKVSWTFGNGQTVSQFWNANLTQSGTGVTATNVSYNGSLAPGANTVFGFLGNSNSTTNTPTSITCTKV